MYRTLPVVMFGVALALAGITASAAMADGLPIPGVYTDSQGVSAPGGGDHYVTSRATDGSTLVQRTAQDGHVLDGATVPGRYVVPAVALDGSPGGLSADGATLVLIQPRERFPQAETRLAVLDASSLEVRDRLTLHGDFSFDAISPDGSQAYFIQYLSRRDPTEYAVRAYDVAAQAFLPEPIVAPDEEDEDEMRGYPLTRVASSDGRWAYTLYDGGGKHPFVHALDTQEGRAVCIDLPEFALQGGPPDRLSVNSDGSALTLDDRHRSVGVVDTQTFEVNEPPPVQMTAESPPPAKPSLAPSASSAESHGGAVPWALVGLAALLGLLAGTTVLVLHRRRRGLAVGGA